MPKSHHDWTFRHFSSALTATALALLAQAVPCAAQTARDSEIPFVQKLLDAHYYVYGQNRSLEILKATHPSLAPQADAARRDFEKSAFGEADRNFEATISSRLKENPTALAEIRSKRAELERQIEDIVAKRQPMDISTAQQFIETVRQRAAGTFTPPIYAQSLLAAHPKFQGAPALEMASGFRTRHATAGHAKSKGRSISFEAPLSWTRAEAKGPNIVVGCQSEAGTGYATLYLMLREFPLTEMTSDPAEVAERQLTQAEYDEALSLLNEDNSAASGHRLIRKERLRVGATDWCLMVSETAMPIEQKLQVRTLLFATMHNAHFVFFSFNLRAASATEMAERELRHMEDFKYILGTLRFDDEATHPKLATFKVIGPVKTADLKIGAKNKAIAAPEGMYIIDRSTDLMEDYVKATFKDAMKGSQMLTFVDAAKPAESPSMSILALDGKLESADIPERLAETLKILANQKRLQEISTRSYNDAAKLGLQPREDAAGFAPGATSPVSSSVVQTDNRHFLIKLSGDGFVNYMATLTCESRMIMINSQGIPATAPSREAKLKALITTVTSAFSAADPSFKPKDAALSKQSIVTSRSKHFSYALPVTWVNREDDGQTELGAAFILHGRSGQMCHMAFVERAMIGTSVDKVLVADMAEITATDTQPLEITDVRKATANALGLQYTEATLLRHAKDLTGDILQTLYVIELSDGRYLTIVFSTQPKRHPTYTKNAKEIIDSLKSLVK